MRGQAEVHSLKVKLDSVFLRTPLSSADIEVQADFARYLCVLVSGFLEKSIVALLLDYIERKSSPEILSFSETQLNRWTNANTIKIVDLFGAFSQEWRIHLDNFFQDEYKDSVNSVIALRHKIAHGQSVGVTIAQIRTHYAVIVKVVYEIASLCSPSTEVAPRN
jgi:RiboL-PSP-HEPN